MIIQIISDIHGSFSDLCAALDTGAHLGAELFVLCGDFLNHGPRNPLPDGYDTKAVATRLNELKERIICVRGNCDSEVDQMMLSFPCLSDYTTLCFVQSLPVDESGALKPNGRVFVHHGHRYTREALASWLPRGTLVISGHTHVPLLEDDGHLFYLNPGSISLPKNDDGKTCAFIETDERGINRIDLCALSGTSLKTLSF